MAGRGFIFKAFKRNVNDDTESEADSTNTSFASTVGLGRGISLGLAQSNLMRQSGNRRENDRPSVSPTPSITSGIGRGIGGIGRGIGGIGRGRFAINMKSQPKTFDSDSVVSSLSETPSKEAVASITSEIDQLSLSSASSTLKSGIGRGMFAITTKSNPPKTSNSDPGATSLSDTPSKETFASTFGAGTSGIIAGRGFSHSPILSSEGRKQISTSSHGKEIPEELAQEEAKKLEVSADTSADTCDLLPVLKHGTSGKTFKAVTNAIELYCDPETGVFEYEVRFHPAVDNLRFRYKYLAQHKEIIGNTKTFDGTILFLPVRLPDSKTYLTSTNVVENEPPVNVEIIFKRKKRLGECIQLYNILFNKIFKTLNYLRVGRKMFDPTAPSLIPAHKLEIWPGYVKSVDELEKGLMLTLDVSHRVLATRTVLELIKDAYRSNPAIWKEEVKKTLLGKVVLTRYNNKTYRIDDIMFDQKPSDSFPHHDGEITYAEYYKKNHNIIIQDAGQPLLLNRMEVRISGEAEKRELNICLVPELCYLTGLDDKMRKNYTLMKDIASYTKMTPLQRLSSYKKYVDNVNNTPEAKAILSQWGLTLATEPTKITFRVLEEQEIIFGNGGKFPVGPKADFSRYATSNHVLEPIDLLNWLLIYAKVDKNEALAFEEMMSKVNGSVGIRVQAPRHIELPNDRTETFVNTLRKELNDPKVQIVVILFPSLRDDRYAAVKKILCSEIPLPSQVIHSKTLRNASKNRSIVQKIILQMNCKMGGTLWRIKIPLPKTMICGIDTHHETGHKGVTVGGFVASLNPEFTRWFSKPTIQQKREELVNGLTASMESALMKFKVFNKYLPDTVIVYRDGVGDGQLNFVRGYELQQFKDAFKRVSPDYSPKLTFVVVQKRINSKFFKMVDSNTGAMATNPPPGAILDHTITDRFLYDFYLVSQHVNQGTTTPSHYIVLHDDNNFEPDIVQRLTYRLCYLYYNWPGTVRVPAPCQYAHKLADLVGVSIKRQVAEKLEDKLYFL